MSTTTLITILSPLKVHFAIHLVYLGRGLCASVCSLMEDEDILKAEFCVWAARLVSFSRL